MKEHNVIKEKSLDFSVRIFNLCRYVREKESEYILTKQLCKSGTSIGANIHEADAAQSNEDFFAKMHIALKEAYETEYWINLLLRTHLISEDEYRSIARDCKELVRLLISITKTTKEHINTKSSKAKK